MKYETQLSSRMTRNAYFGRQYHDNYESAWQEFTSLCASQNYPIPERPIDETACYSGGNRENVFKIELNVISQ